MKPPSIVLIAAACCLAALHAGAQQERIVLMDGDTVDGTVDTVKEMRMTYTVQNRKRTVRKHIATERVFSIIHADGREEYVYRQDTTLDNDFSVEQVKMYIRGEQEARTYYRSPFSTIAGVVVGGASSYFGLFWGLLPPALYISITGSGTPYVARHRVSDEALKKDAQFVQGYEKTARARKVKNAAIGSLSGLMAGIVAFQLAAER